MSHLRKGAGEGGAGNIPGKRNIKYSESPKTGMSCCSSKKEKVLRSETRQGPHYRGHRLWQASNGPGFYSKYKGNVAMSYSILGSQRNVVIKCTVSIK